MFTRWTLSQLSPHLLSPPAHTSPPFSFLPFPFWDTASLGSPCWPHTQSNHLPDCWGHGHDSHHIWLTVMFSSSEFFLCSHRDSLWSYVVVQNSHIGFLNLNLEVVYFGGWRCGSLSFIWQPFLAFGVFIFPFWVIFLIQRNIYENSGVNLLGLGFYEA